MYEITIQKSFNATHAIVIAGVREPVHGHDWQVVATIAGPRLDEAGLLCDFHELESALASILDPWNHTHLNDAADFAGVEPTAEWVATVVAQRLAAALGGRLPGDARVARVGVTEAPGCVATYLPW